MAVANEAELFVEEVMEEATETTGSTEVQDTLEVTTIGKGQKQTRNRDKWKSKYARKTGRKEEIT
uniref:Uncharacterized protein n=1 Tax=Amphimedon queenslandica TaxID=400682 RepID=A0A1X7TTR3_AMPQE